MTTFDLRQVGSGAVAVSPIGFGTSPLGDMPETYGHSVDEARALETLDAIIASSVNMIDTSRNYGEGRSEQRIGMSLRSNGYGSELPEADDKLVLATKLDREAGSGRFDAAAARRSFEDSLEAMGLDRVHILHLHDPEYAADLDEVTRPGGSMDELFKIRDEGLADVVGLAMGRLDVMEPLVERYDFDIILNHNRFTLLNRSADRMYTAAAERGIAIFNAAPYSGGVLAKGSDQSTTVTYQEADDEALAPVRALEALCAEHEVPLGAAALQFSMRDPRITSTIIGVSKPDRVATTLSWAELAIPEAFWAAVFELPYGTDDPEAGRDWVPG